MIFASLFCNRTNVLDVVVHLYYNKKNTFGGHKMKNTSYKNKQFVLLGMTFLSVAGIAGCSKVELAQSTVTLELGDELSENVADYLQDPDEKILKGASLDLSAVDETKVGSYNAAIAYDGKNYPFTVEVKDTTSPQCEAKDYIYMQPGSLTVDDLVTKIKDASETSSGIVSCEQKEDLVVCDYDDMLQERAAVDMQSRMMEQIIKKVFSWMMKAAMK